MEHVLNENLLKYFNPETTEDIKVIEGTHSVSHAVRLARVQVISAYPITPQTSIVEKLSEMCAGDDLDAQFIKVESEHSAMAAVIGSEAGGARSFTATSSQGLALMHEVLHWAAGGRLPIVLANVNRALGPPWNIWVDQSDSLAQRDTGWIQFYCESNQEVLDMVLQAFRLGEQVMLPVMINLDAFFLSHTSEPVAIPKQELVDRFLPPYKPKFKMDVGDPHAFGGLGGPNVYMEFRHNMQQSMEEAKRLIPVVAEEYANLIGRHHGTMIEKYRADNADYLLITAGTLAGTTRLVIDALRDEGVNIGMIKMRTFRPFPTEELRDAVRGVKKIGVIDRNISFGQSGIFFSEIKAALYNGEHHPLMNGYVAGLGGRDVVPATIREIAEHMMASDKGQDLIWIGVKA